MNNTLNINEEVTFNASPQKVWDLLTNPAMTKQYMFGCEVLSTWEVGHPIDWKGQTEDGKEIVYVKGNIIEYVEGHKVTLSMFDPHMGFPDIPENYIHLTYELKEIETGTHLTITQKASPKAENVQQRLDESKKGWEMIIPAMKQLVVVD